MKHAKAPQWTNDTILEFLMSSEQRKLERKRQAERMQAAPYQTNASSETPDADDRASSHRRTNTSAARPDTRGLVNGGKKVWLLAVGLCSATAEQLNVEPSTQRYPASVFHVHVPGPARRTSIHAAHCSCSGRTIRRQL